MSQDEVRRVADAVLYEGYILYPYRASAQKNRSRWQFGVLMPPAFAAADSCESAAMRAECVFTRDGEPSVSGGPSVEVTVRFLQVQRRHSGDEPAWDEAVEREVTVTADGPALSGEGIRVPFTVPGGEDREPAGHSVSGSGDAESAGAGNGDAGSRDTGNGNARNGDARSGDAVVVRTRRPLAGTVSVRAVALPGPWRAARLEVEAANETVLPRAADGAPGTRDEALPGALVAAHLIITLSGGAFVSMTDPPEWAGPAVAECQSAGCWPVLAGPEGSRGTMLAAPIILPEYPRVAEESAGELYDGTEIDEILTLRTLALTGEEKAAARATDPRAAALIDRVEAMDATALESLHGTIRAMTRAPTGATGEPAGSAGEPTGAGADVPWWDPGAEASVSPGTDSVVVAGKRLARGSRVTLRPGARRADAQDMFLAGREALVEAVLEDVDGSGYLAVSLVDDPGADIRSAHGRFLYFAPDEVEPR